PLLRRTASSRSAPRAGHIRSASPPELDAGLLRRPLHHREEVLPLTLRHVDRVLRRGVNVLPNFIPVAREHVLDNRNEVTIDLRMPRGVLLIEVEKIAGNDVDTVGLVPRPERNDRYRKRLRQVLAYFLGRDLTENRETASVHHRPGVVDELLRSVGRLALGSEAAELRHAHRCDSDVALYRDPRLDDGLDVLGMVPVALALHDLGPASWQKRPAFSTACSGET